MKIVVDGQLLDYSDEGKGKVVVLLHGWGQTRHTFDDLAVHLVKRKFRVLRIDFPGFGGSPQPREDWHVLEYAQLVGAFVEKVGLKELYVIGGHSFGGRVIIKGIAEKLFSPKKVLLIGTAGLRPRDSARRFAYKMVAKTGKAVTALPGLRSRRDALRRRLYTSAGAMDFYNAGSMKKIFQHTVSEDLLPMVHAVTQPTLLVWGEHDDQTPVAQAQAILGQLKHGTLEVVKDAGHFVHTDKPDEVYDKIDRFLA